MTWQENYDEFYDSLSEAKKSFLRLFFYYFKQVRH